MESSKQKSRVTVQAVIQAPVETIWRYWSEPEHIMKWSQASDTWYAPKAENELRVGGRFLTRMEAKDGSAGFDFGGVYDVVREYEEISYTLGDGRKVDITFNSLGKETEVVEVFDAENTHSIDMQQAGWQAILDNFKKYTENLKKD